ncbi:hypothetical protein A8C56_03640 [Niabella ginsenosidivorans]|uniref:histidine kinase n=1 Tax=Niabella ginsenosidivorans TaxID=1176587 RepID=A0A1A9I0I0_9BACT|nr:sensor histidine kinase [Niabella ginsenosidivorans]ANH80192.1 hypothetical protein A8C56_03640 [Niabella ginsenosidivorans]
MKKALFVLGFVGALLLTLPAQEITSMSAYAVNPVRTPDALLNNWRRAKTIEDQFKAAADLIRFHEASGTTDSVLFYAAAMQSTLQQKNINTAQKLKYTSSLDYSMAKAYQDQGLYDEALRYYLRGINDGEQLKDPSIIDRNQFGQATVYYLRGENKEAIRLYNQVLYSSRDSNLVHLIHKQLGILYLAQQELPKAKGYFTEALGYFRQTGQLKNELETRLNLAFIMELEHQLDTAYSAFAAIKDEAQASQFYDLYIKAGQHIGDILFAKKDYENAQITLSMVYMNAVQWGDLEAQRRAIRSLEKLYVAQGDYKNAYALGTQYIGVMNDITSRQNKKEVNELEIRYNTARKEKELLQKENQLQHQRTVKYGLLIGFIAVLLPVIGLLYMYYQKLQTQSRLNASREEANRQKITAMLKEKELEVLKASVEGEENERRRISKELHDSIGGNLAAIKMQLFNKQNEKLDAIVHQIDATYQQVRDLSHNLAPKSFHNTAFTELIRAYLQRFNTGGKQELRFQAYPEAVMNDMDLDLKVELYKIIQELMTNAQKYAQASAIELQLTLVDHALKLIFEDNGRGFPTDKTPPGIGLQNIRERLKSFNGTLSIDSFPGRGTVVDIEIPLNRKSDET